MPPVEIMKGVYWVGAVDWNIRDFHGYSTERGTSYNSYLVIDDKITLFDTVKKGFASDLLHNVRKLVDPEKIDYIVVNHVELDHSGSLPEVMEAAKPEKLICSKMGKAALLSHFHREDWPYQTVATGDEISLGQRTVAFLETKMLHWPDSMFSYLKEDKLLISSDGFGQHWATSKRFADEVDQPELMRHAAKYYANILLLFSDRVQKLIETVTEMGLQIDVIAPDHGLIWRKDPTGPGAIVAAYDQWSKQAPSKKALIIYDSMWQSTETMAKAIYAGLLEKNVCVKLLNLKYVHRSDVMAEVLDAGALIIGSATINNGMLPTVADILSYLKGLRPANKIGAAFGSYGWSGEAAKLVSQALVEMKIEVVSDPIRAKYVPDHEALAPCVDLGRKIGDLLNQG